MRAFVRPAVALCVLLGTAASVQAQVIHDHSTQTGAFAGPNMGGPFTVATRFVMASGFALDGVRFWGGEHPTLGAGNTSIQWSIFADDGANQRGTLLESGSAALTRTSEGTTPYGWNRYLYEFDVGGLDFATGTYWLALHATGGGYALYWQTSNLAAEDRSVQWYTYDSYYAGGHAFQLTGSENSVVPEPISLALLGTGLAGIAGARRRRRLGLDGADA